MTGIISINDAKTSLGITTNTHDIDLLEYVEAATPVIERITGPVVGREATYTFDGGQSSYLLPYPLNEVSEVTVDGSPVAFYVNLTAGIVYATGGVFSRGIQNVIITATVGYAGGSYPENIRLATRELIRFWWQQGRQGNRPAWGNEPTAEVDVSTGYAVPMRVIELLKPHARVGGFA